MEKPKARYVVLQDKGEWKINLDNRYYGPFANADEAERMAIETARQATERGYDASVILMFGMVMKMVWPAPETKPPFI
jgi:hypothetical protein